MKFIAKLFGLTVIGTVFLGIRAMPVWSQSLNPDSVKKLAGQYTVRIRSTAAEPGSGAIIARQGNRYTVLTAAHVLGTLNAQSNGVCAFLRTYDSQNHLILLKSARLLPDNDLAIVEFETTRDYPVATLSTYQYPLRDQRNYQNTSSNGESQESGNTYDRLTINQDYRKQFSAFTLGYPNLKEADNSLECSQAPSTQDMGATDLSISAGQLIDTSGTAITNPEARYRNYEMVYTNMTYVGMSGGPIVDPNGRLIGIHGRSDGKTLDRSLKNVIKEYNPEVDAKEEVRFRLGMSLGVPLSTVLRLAPRLQLQSATLNISSQAPNTPDVNPTEWAESNDFRKYNNYEQSPLYWLEQGNQQWRIGQIDLAQQSFDRALELDQKQRGVLQHYVYFMKGFAYAQAQQHDKALANCIKSTEMVQGKEFYDAWRCQASEYAYLKQFPEATVALNKAIDLRKRVANSGEQGKIENPSDYVILAELLSAQGDHSNALEKSTIAMVLRSSQDLGDSATLRNLRATILTKMKRYDEALYECDRAVSLDSSYATPWVTKGIILDRQNKKTEAIVAYRKATSVNPEDSNSWDNLGFSLYESGQEKEALAAFEKAVRLDPKNSSAKANLEDLRKSMKP